MKNPLGPDLLCGCYSLPLKETGSWYFKERNDKFGLSLSFSLVWFKRVDLPPCLLIMTDERPINPETWMKMMKQLVAKKTM